MLAGVGGQHRMARPYSQDLRDRVVGSVAAGRTCRATAALFGVSVASVVKWSQRWRATGSAAAGRWAGGSSCCCWRAGVAAGADRREAGPDVAGGGGRAGRARHAGELWRGVAVLRARRDHVQKKACTPASRTAPTSRAARRQWKKYQGRLDPRRLVFIDETWAKTNMTRRHGRCARGSGWSPRCRTAAGAR